MTRTVRILPVNWKLVLALSVALNVALALVLQVERRSPSTSAHPGAHPIFASQITRPPGKMWASSLSADGNRKKTRPPSASEMLEAEDYPTFVKKLRAAGLSEDTISTLLVAEITNRNSQELTELQLRWNRGDLTQDEYQNQMWQMTRDRDALLENLMGKDGYRHYQFEHDNQVQQLAMTGKFSEEALGQYFDLNRKYEEKRQELYQKLDTQSIDNEDYQRESMELEKSYRGDLEKAMGGKLAHQLVAELDGNIQNLRRQLKGTALTDDELGQMVQVLQDYEQE